MTSKLMIKIFAAINKPKESVGKPISVKSRVYVATIPPGIFGEAIVNSIIINTTSINLDKLTVRFIEYAVYKTPANSGIRTDTENMAWDKGIQKLYTFLSIFRSSSHILYSIGKPVDVLVVVKAVKSN